MVLLLSSENSDFSLLIWGFLIKKTALAILTGLSLAITPFAGLAAAQAATVSIVMFSNEDVTDPSEEDADMAAAMSDLGTVTLFNGGDGSAEAWTGALATADSLVLPEGIVYESAFLSAGAVDVIRAYIAAGHTVIGTGAYDHSGLIDDLTGISRNWNNGSLSGDDTWNLQVDSDELPSTLPNADYAGGISNYADWTDAQRVGVTPLYLNEEGTNAGVATFTIGSGAFVYYGYDWYPDPNDVSSGARAAWNDALRLGASGDFTDVVNPPVADVLAFNLTLNLAVGDAVAGANATAEASGLLAGSEWNLVLRSTPITLDTGLVGTDGRLISMVSLPAGLEAGAHTLTLTGTGADGVSYQRYVSFVIAADGTLASAPVLSDLMLASAEIAVAAVTAPTPVLAATGVSAAAPFALAVLALLAGIVVVGFRRRATV